MRTPLDLAARRLLEEANRHLAFPELNTLTMRNYNRAVFRLRQRGDKAARRALREAGIK